MLCIVHLLFLIRFLVLLLSCFLFSSVFFRHYFYITSLQASPHSLSRTYFFPFSNFCTSLFSFSSPASLLFLSFSFPYSLTVDHILHPFTYIAYFPFSIFLYPYFSFSVPFSLTVYHIYPSLFLLS